MVDEWREVGPASNLNFKGKRGEKMGFSPIFLAKPAVGVSIKREKRNFSFSLRSTEIRWSESVEARFKVHLLDEGYVWVPTTCSFTEDFRFGE